MYFAKSERDTTKRRARQQPPSKREALKVPKMILRSVIHSAEQGSIQKKRQKPEKAGKTVRKANNFATKGHTYLWPGKKRDRKTGKWVEMI